MTDPTMRTAADYETHIRPHLAALEAERDRLRNALRNLIDQTPASHPLYEESLRALFSEDS